MAETAFFRRTQPEAIKVKSAIAKHTILFLSKSSLVLGNNTHEELAEVHLGHCLNCIRVVKEL